MIHWTVQAGSESSVRFNSAQGGCAIGCARAIRIQGDQSIIQDNNVLDTNEHGIFVDGTENVILNNEARTENPGHSGWGILIDGNANVIEDNIILPAFNFRLTTGGSGNFYGNNRVSAPTIFLGTDGWVDWGDNVRF